MRGVQDRQTSMLAYVCIEERIPSDHPLRGIKGMADQELKKLSGVFNRMYSQIGRPSVAPERILKSLLLIALYSVRSEKDLTMYGFGAGGELKKRTLGTGDADGANAVAP
jgi:transposase